MKRFLLFPLLVGCVTVSIELGSDSDEGGVEPAGTFGTSEHEPAGTSGTFGTSEHEPAGTSGSSGTLSLGSSGDSEDSTGAERECSLTPASICECDQEESPFSACGCYVALGVCWCPGEEIVRVALDLCTEDCLPDQMTGECYCDGRLDPDGC